MNEAQQVVCVEFESAAWPFSVVVMNERGGTDFYQIEWCRRDRCLYSHMSGFGGNPYLSGYDPYWALPDVSLAGIVRPELRLDRMPPPFTFEAILELVGDGCDETHYCSVCDDHLPTEHLCGHIWHCEEGCGVVGFGSNEGGADECPHTWHCAACGEYVNRSDDPLERPTHCRCGAARFYERLGKEGRWVQVRQDRYLPWSPSLAVRLSRYKHEKRANEMQTSGSPARPTEPRETDAAAIPAHGTAANPGA